MTVQPMTAFLRCVAAAACLLPAALVLAGPGGAAPASSPAVAAQGAASGRDAKAINVSPFPGATLPPGYVTTPGAAAGWSVATDSFFDAPNSLKSGAIANDQRADVETTVTTGAGTMSFARRVSSEAGFDFLRFTIDGAEVAWWSGEVAWEVVQFPVTAGAHVFRWSYQKDASDAAGADAAWIDAVVFPEPVVPTEDLTVTRAGTGGGTVTSSPPGIDCGDACSTEFPAGSTVTLTAVAATGSAFSGWSGACVGMSACVVTMAEAREVTATFTSGASPPRLVNIAARGPVYTGDYVMIGGFVIGGSAPKKVLITARGPSLAAFNVPGVLPNPSLVLYSGQAVVAANDDWGTNANAAEIAATGIGPTDALESAILVTLDPGPYTAIVYGTGGATGIGIVEVFEVDKPEVPLVNIATRAPVLTGDSVLIGGFVIQGDGPKTVLVTARGPSLAAQGVPGVLANPALTLYAGQTVIATNDDWGTNANAAAIQATGVAPADPLESALLLTLNPGAYTAIVTGAGGATGIGIVEIFAR